MSPKPTPTIVPDADKTREQLLFELQELRAQMAILRENEIKSKGVAEALRKSEAHLARAQEISHLGSWESDLITDLQQWSDESYRIFGFLPGGVNPDMDLFLSLVHPDDKGRLLDMMKSVCRAGGFFKVDYRIVRPDGTIRYVHSEGEVARDESGRAVKMFGINQDITERRQAEETLANAKDQLASELDAMDRLHAISVQYVFNGDLTAVLDEIIDAAISITRADMGNIQIPDPESGWLKIVTHRGFEQPFLDYFDSVAEGHAACGTAMMRLERVVIEDVTQSPVFMGTPDLEVMLAAGARAVQSTPLLSRTGRLLGMLSTHYRTPHRPDERELKLIDLLTRQTADIIERTLAEKQLVDSKKQAELYLDLMGHDINNMHQIALGYLELARDMPAGDGQAVFLDKPMEVLQRSAQLISNVRKLQKLRDGVFQDRDVDVCRVVSDVQREYGAMPNKTITLNLNGLERCNVRANELLHDVFSNMVSNAVKHTGDRADILVGVDIVKYKGGRYCRVMIEDDGPGIPDDFKERIFNRALKSTDKAKGMGLGLYMVKSLVDSYNGRLWVEDRVLGDHTKGARFVVMLPVVEK
jgi:PAS domain S-box-containing protein